MVHGVAVGFTFVELGITHGVAVGLIERVDVGFLVKEGRTHGVAITVVEVTGFLLYEGGGHGVAVFVSRLVVGRLEVEADLCSDLEAQGESVMLGKELVAGPLDAEEDEARGEVEGGGGR